MSAADAAASNPSVDAFRELSKHLGWSTGPKIPTCFAFVAWDCRAVLHLNRGASGGQQDIKGVLKLEREEKDAMGEPTWLPQGAWCVTLSLIKGSVVTSDFLRSNIKMAVGTNVGAPNAVLIQLLLSRFWTHHIVKAHIQRMEEEAQEPDALKRGGRIPRSVADKRARRERLLRDAKARARD